jgi:hypothetical protein
MDLKKTLVGTVAGLGLIGLLAIPTNYASEAHSCVSKLPKQEYKIKLENRFNLEGRYSIPFNVSRQETILYGADDESINEVFNLAIDSSKMNQWTHATVSIDETKYPGSGADMYMRVYPDKEIFTQLTIGYDDHKSKQSLDENVNEFIIKTAPSNGNIYIKGSKSKIKLDQKDAIEFKLTGLTNKTVIFTINKDKIYRIVYGSYYTQKDGDAIDPENSLKKFEKGFRFSD